eukprot:TRINITY_DN1558_c0_g2_i6.p1 TRINITY_DN1558_c0_g2~~TRINITY_DN1558_c0_g2_i6.p1  ORF type:complete len:416 (+),score=79.39 TRINITY_DN1558_c0_g2_i6:590-1837(+)
MPEPGEDECSLKFVLETYLNDRTVLELIPDVDNGRYFYQSIPKFAPVLLTPSHKPLENLVAKAESKLERMAFRQTRLPLCETELTMRDKAIEMWVTLWCGALQFHDPCEHYCRLLQLTQVLAEYECSALDRLVGMYSRILQACASYGSSRLVILFFDGIKRPGIASHPLVFKWYLRAITSSSNSQCLPRPTAFACPRILEESKGRPSVESKAAKQFQQRSILTQEIKHVACEEVKIGLRVLECPQCEKKTPDIRYLGEETDTFLCEHCGAQLTGEIRVRVGRTILGKKRESTWQQEYLTLPLDTIEREIRAWTGHAKSFGLDMLRESQQLFWNVVWYCQVFKFPYDLFIPYKSVLKTSLPVQKKPVRNPTKKAFTLTPEKNQWAEDFKKVRVLEFCHEEGVQTEFEPESPTLLNY